MLDAEKIKELREKTAAGFADCKKALEETQGNVTKAIIILKKKGFEKAAKKEGRATSQGLIETYVHAGGKIGVVVEASCETDFVARTDEFKNLTHEIAMQIAAMNPKNVEELMEQEYIRDPSLKINDIVKSAIAKLGENIQVKRFSRIALGD